MKKDLVLLNVVILIVLQTIVAATTLTPKYQNTSSSCSRAKTIKLGNYYGITTGVNTQNVTCNYLYPSGTAWFRFIGTGHYVQADTCQYSSVHTVKVSIHTGTCSKLTCIPSVASNSVCGKNQNTFTRWFAKLGQVYYVYVAARQYPPTQRSKFQLAISGTFTNAPTPAPTFPSCDVCASKGSVTNVQAQVAVPGLANVACGDIGTTPIPPTTCAALQSRASIRKTCGCQVFTTGINDCNTGGIIKPGQTIWGSNIGQGFADICQSHTTAGSVWYRFVGTGGLITIDTCRYADSPTSVAVVNGTCSIQICFDYVQSTCGINQYGNAVSFFSILNQTYFVVVYGSPDFPGQGNFALTLSDKVPPLPSSPPTPAPTCYVCGGRQKRVTKPNAIVQLPTLGKVNCSHLQDLAFGNLLKSTSCSSVTSAVQKTCGCQFFEVPHTCQNAPTIRLGQIVYGSTVGAITGPGNVGCILSHQGPGSWYRFIGNGMQVTATSFLIPGLPYPFSTYAFYGNCSSLGCLDYYPTTWFATKGVEYFIFVTDKDYFSVSVVAATPAPTQRPSPQPHKPSPVAGSPHA